jgi:hypothetical protein
MPNAWWSRWQWRSDWTAERKFQDRCLHEGGVGIDAAPEHAGSSVTAAQKAINNPNCSGATPEVGHGKLLNKAET